jgi:hypothetical protein
VLPSRSITAMARGSRLSDSKRTEQALRTERLARALRDNLHRRKEQARERNAGANDAPSSSPEPDRRKSPA